MNYLRCVALFIFSCFGSWAGASGSYVPTHPSPLTESWRWHGQEALEGLTLIDCLEGPDGDLWFVSETGILRYDGLEVETFAVPGSMELDAYRSGVMTRKGLIYMMLPGQIVEFDKGRYTTVLSFDGRYDMVSSRAELMDDDTVVFGTPEGIVSIRDGKARIISIHNDRASFLRLDSQGNMWTNKVGSGLVLRYQGFSTDGKLDDDGWESFRVLPDFGVHLTITELPDGTIWCANDNPHYGIFAFDPDSSTWFPLPIDADSEEKVHYRVHVSPDGTVIIYGDKRILLYKNGRTGQLTLDDFKFPLSYPFIRSLRSGSMIIGGRRETVYLVDCSSRIYESFQGLNYFCTDLEGLQWFISFEGWIVSHNPATGEWDKYDSEDGAINTPLSLMSTSGGNIWAVGRHDNVAAISIFSDGVWDLRVHPEMGTRISHQSLRELRDGTILLGSGDTDPENLPGRGGLLKYEINGLQYTTTHYAPPRVPFRIVGIDEKPDGTILVGGKQLSWLKDFKAEPLPSLGNFRNTWVDNFIWTESGDLWVAQWGVGIHIFDGEEWVYSGDFENKLARGVVALHEDQLFPGQVWAATSEGLFNFDKKSWVDEPLSRGLAILREGGKLFQSPNGTIWLNSSSRNWHFRDTGIMPGSDRFGDSFRTTALRRYDIFPDTRIVEYEDTVHEPGVTHFAWTGSCEWSVAQTEELSYSFRINGGEWTPFSKRTEVVFETQENGLHTFEVRSRTPSGQIDPTPASVEFRVIPVLWKQPWFILAVLTVVIIVIALVIVIVRQRIAHLLALEEYKIQFFTNISHELRTPLMVILGPLESLLKHVDEKGKQHLEIAYRNARKLAGLLDRLLDFRKAELGKIQMNPQILDIVLFIRQEMESLRPLATAKGQHLDFPSGLEELNAAIDPKLLEVILDNLLTNAIKYTPQGGTISIHLDILSESENQVDVKIGIEDTGPGIPRKELGKVFDPFYQIGGEVDLKSHSTGIGLAHTKSIVEAVGGTIHVESPVNRDSTESPGSRFVVELSLALESKSEVAVKEVPAEAGEKDSDSSDEVAYSSEKKPLLLVVEDNDDISEFLNLEFKPIYTVLLAVNGVAGLKIAREHIPDIIVSDILMPEMDGRELCRQLKTDQSTSHIPVVLLTALKSEANELAGLETGADDYVTKPVNVALLRKRLENILLNRRKVREFISGSTRSITINKDELPVNKIDQDFMAKFMDTIEANLTNETFDVEDLAKRMFMSRMTLYRKVKALTGESPGNIIRTIRLKKAAQYLETGSWSVGQVIERVGILDMSHFSRSFKKEYGLTPTEYIERYSVSSVTTGEKTSPDE